MGQGSTRAGSGRQPIVCRRGRLLGEPLPGLHRHEPLPIIEAVNGSLGRLAQWLERLVHTEEVGGSNPPSPTIQAARQVPDRGANFQPAEVAKRQTRCVQGAVSLWTCGFKSLPRHHPYPVRAREWPASGHNAGPGRREDHRVPVTAAYALVAQRIERCPAEAEVVGSNPAKRAIM